MFLLSVGLAFTYKLYTVDNTTVPSVLYDANLPPGSFTEMAPHYNNGTIVRATKCAVLCLLIPTCVAFQRPLSNFCQFYE